MLGNSGTKPLGVFLLQGGCGRELPVHVGRRRRISGPTVMGTHDITAFLFADLVQGVPQVSLGEHRVLLD